MSRAFLSVNGEPFMRLTRAQAADTLRQARAIGRVEKDGRDRYRITIEGAGRCVAKMVIR